MGFLARLLAGVMIVVLLLWFGAEAALLYGARRMADGGRLDISRARMMTDPTRIGITLEGVGWLRRAGDVLDMTDLALWLPPWAPNDLHVSLPSHTRQTGQPGHRDFDIEAGEIHARFSPFRRLAMVEGGLVLDRLRIDGESLLGPTALTMSLTNYGADVPPEIRAAYRLDIEADEVALPVITKRWEIGEASGETPGIARITGPLVLMLSHVISPRQSAPPEFEGVTFNGVFVEIDGHQQQIWGQLARDETGQIGGEIALDMPDLRGFVLAASHAGLFPVRYAHLVATALETVADDAAQEGADSMAAPVTSTDLQLLRAQGGPRHIPPRPADMRRIPVRLSAGQVHIGNLPLSALLSGAADDDRARLRD